MKIKGKENLMFGKMLKDCAIKDKIVYRRYLKDIFRELSTNTTMTLTSFKEFVNMPFFITKRLMSMFSNAKSENKIKFSEFSDGLEALYANDNVEKYFEQIFYFLDVDETGKLTYENLKRIFINIFFHRNNFNSLKLIDFNIIDEILLPFFGNNKVSQILYSDFIKLIQDSCDVLLIISLYLMLYQPFSAKIQEFYQLDPRLKATADLNNNDNKNYLETSVDNDTYFQIEYNFNFTKTYIDVIFGVNVSEFLSRFTSQSDESTNNETFDKNNNYIQFDDVDEEICECGFVLPESHEFQNSFTGVNRILYSESPSKNSTDSLDAIVSNLQLSGDKSGINQEYKINDSHCAPKVKSRFSNSSISVPKISSGELNSSDQSKNKSKSRQNYINIIQSDGFQNFILKENINISTNGAAYESIIYKLTKHGNFKQICIVIIGRILFYFKNNLKTNFKGVRLIRCDSLTASSFKCSKEKSTKYMFTLHLVNKDRKYFVDTLKEYEKIYNVLSEAINFKNFPERYIIDQCLQSGKYSIVFKAFDTLANTNVVVKAFPKKENMIEGTRYEFVLSEIEVTKFCNHPNIVKYIDDFHDHENIYLVTEYLSKGDLCNYLGNHNISKNNIIEIFHKVALGLDYLHKNGIIHRDIKNENIALSENMCPKIIDFGFSRFAGDNEKMFDPCGTVVFAAPEIMKFKSYGFKVDVFSLGITMYLAIEGRMAFHEKIKNNSKFVVAPEELIFGNNFEKMRLLKELIKKCIASDVSNRISIKNIISHELFSKLKHQET